MAGRSFGRYRLDRLLGRGGMGEVWLAHDTVADRVVALKILSATYAADADYRRRFQREARIGTSLRGPHIVPIHTFGEHDGRLFLAMEYIEGADLSARLARGEVSNPAAAVAVIAQIATALDTAHAAGLIHRDVKPANIIVAPTGSAYLIDFGIAQAYGQTAVTAAGLAMGTWAYMAPERFAGKVDARSDVYSLACVLYECLTRRRPYGDTDPAQQMHAHLMAEPPRAATLNPAVGAELDAVIAHGMAKDPAHRYTGAGEFGAAARAAVGDGNRRVRTGDRNAGPGSTKVLPGPRPEHELSPAAAYPVAGGGPAVEPRALPPTRVSERELSPAAAYPVDGGEPFAEPRALPPTKVMPEPGLPKTLVATRIAAPASPVPFVRPVYQQDSPYRQNLPRASRPGAFAPVAPRPVAAGPVPVALRRSKSAAKRAPMSPTQWQRVPSGRKGLRRTVYRPVPKGWVPPRRRKGRGLVAKLVGALVVVFVTPFVLAAGCFALIAGSTGGGRTSDPTVAVDDQGPPPVTDPPAPAPAGLNVPVRDGKFEFIVTDIENGVPSVGFERAKGAFTIVTLTVQNISDEPKAYLPFGQQLFDTQGRRYDHDVTATAQRAALNGHYPTNLQPTQTITAELVFGVPTDSTPSGLVLRDFPLSTGATVALQ